jgi:hypothetical protein
MSKLRKKYLSTKGTSGSGRKTSHASHCFKYSCMEMLDNCNRWMVWCIADWLSLWYYTLQLILTYINWYVCIKCVRPQLVIKSRNRTLDFGNKVTPRMLTCFKYHRVPMFNVLLNSSICLSNIWFKCQLWTNISPVPASVMSRNIVIQILITDLLFFIIFKDLAFLYRIVWTSSGRLLNWYFL